MNKQYRIVFFHNKTGLRNTKFVYSNSPREAVAPYLNHKIVMVQEILEDDCRQAIRINEKEWK